MAELDEREVLAGVKSVQMPIFNFLAYPPHVVFVPEGAFIGNVAVGILVALVIGIAQGELVNPIAMALSTFSGHVYLAYKYYDDRHFLSVWRARFLEGKPRPPIVRMPSVLVSRRGVNRFS